MKPLKYYTQLIDDIKRYLYFKTFFIRKIIPNYSLYKYNNKTIAILPYFMIQRFKYQGVTSIGCIKCQIQMGWLIFGFTIGYNHTL